MGRWSALGRQGQTRIHAGCRRNRPGLVRLDEIAAAGDLPELDPLLIDEALRILQVRKPSDPEAVPIIRAVAKDFRSRSVTERPRYAGRKRHLLEMAEQIKVLGSR